VVAGSWLIVAPFALQYGGPVVATANDVVGVVLVLVGSTAWLKYGRAG
jgi:hypothetical protein